MNNLQSKTKSTKKEGKLMEANEIKLELVITNTDEILATAKRLQEISKELMGIAYKLQTKQGLKEKQPMAATNDCLK